MATAQDEAEEQATRAEVGGTLPERFQPRFWSDCDNRVALVRAIKEKVQQLKADCNADSMQKETLCERAIFLITVLETQEVNAVHHGKIDLGSYTQGLNTLMGVLRTLGLERKAKKIGTLSDYVSGGQQ